jgi:hypothetical protein
VTKWHFSVLSLVLVFLVLGAAACVPPAPPLRKSIVGHWANAQGAKIEFNADGTGVVPAILDLPAYSFTYSFPDDRHVKINLGGQELSVGIAIAGDRMTWSNSYNNTEYVYTRTK